MAVVRMAPAREATCPSRPLLTLTAVTGEGDAPATRYNPGVSSARSTLPPRWPPAAILSPAGQILILPGDVISVQKAGVVYVLGKFNANGIYPLSGNESTTLIQLAAKLGDPAFSAKPHELRLIRTTNGQRHFVVIDYKAIVEGKKPDPILQSGDILYMPTSAFKAAIACVGVVLVLTGGGKEASGQESWW